MGRPRNQRGAVEPGATTLQWNPYQQAFLQAKAARTPTGKRQFDRLSLFAGRGGGKTCIGAIGSVQEMRPKTYGWVCAPTYPDLQDFVLPEVMKLIAPSWIADWSQSRLEMSLINGARIAFRSLDDPERARGPGLDWVWIDEAAKCQKLAWDVMSPALVRNAGMAIFTTTPRGLSNWTYSDLWKRALEGEPGYWATRYWTEKNPRFNDPDIRAGLERDRRTMDPVFFAQEYQADFVTFSGAIYGANIDSQVIRRDDPRLARIFPEWPKISPNRVAYVGLDPGADHPFAAVLLVSSERGLVQVGEYIARNRSASEHKRGIYEMLARWNSDRPFRPEQWAIDRSQRQMAIELAQPPFPINVTPAENNIRAGVNRVLSWLQSGQFWILADECKRTVEQLRGYRWEEMTNSKGEYKAEQPVKVEDDLPDALRYCLMLWPEVPVTVEAPTLRPGLENFSDEQLWSVQRQERIYKRELGIEDPDDELIESDDPGQHVNAARPSRMYFNDDEGGDGIGSFFQ